MPRSIRGLISNQEKSFEAALNNVLVDVDDQDRLLLVIEKKLTPKQLDWLKEQLQGIWLTKLRLFVDASLIESAEFLSFIDSLPRDSLRYLELGFSVKETNSQVEGRRISDQLTRQIAPRVHFPVIITDVNSAGRCEGSNEYHMRAGGIYNRATLKLNDFECQVIANTQKRMHELSQTKRVPRIHDDGVDDPSLPKIRLKSLIKGVVDVDAEAATTIEVQHTEEVEHEAVAETNEEVQLEEQVQTQSYLGRTIGHQEFCGTYERMSLDSTQYTYYQRIMHFNGIINELFANLPHAIEFLSPAAAEELSKHITQFIAFNTHNLPQGFLIKKTKLGELVLDFDIGYERTPTPFTPCDNLLYDEIEPLYYDLSRNPGIPFPSEETVRKWLGLERSKPHDLANKILHPYLRPNRLVNLWIRYGDHSVERFLKKFKEIASEPLRESLFDDYLRSFHQWDHLMDSDRFFHCIDRINQYDVNQINTFRGLLRQTSDSLHDL